MLALVVGVMAGCAQTNQINSEQQANRTYMSQVNEIMDQLNKELDSFVDAVSRGDIVNMRTQADNAYKTLDKLSTLEAPEALADVQECYVEGTAKMREALDAYISLYTELDAGSFDQSTYTKRIAEVQELYDEGVVALKKGDETAASKQ
jgi:hypothetical protein